jgi:hypothetical protein
MHLQHRGTKQASFFMKFFSTVLIKSGNGKGFFPFFNGFKNTMVFIYCFFKLTNSYFAILN